jgi:hypothetical protein
VADGVGDGLGNGLGDGVSVGAGDCQGLSPAEGVAVVVGVALGARLGPVAGLAVLGAAASRPMTPVSLRRPTVAPVAVINAVRVAMTVWTPAPCRPSVDCVPVITPLHVRRGRHHRAG